MKYLPDLKYIPDNLSEIKGSTPLKKGIPLNIFLPNIDLSHIPELEDRKQIFRNMMPQAHIYQYVTENQTNFADYKLKVIEGLYNPENATAVTTDSILDLEKQGRAVVYELHKNGQVDVNKTIELAYHLSVFQNHYDKIILDYDNYSPKVDLNVQLIIIMPNIPEDYNVKFKKEHETYFNNNSLGSDLIAIEVEKTSPSEDLPEMPDASHTGFLSDEYLDNIPVGGNGNIDPNKLVTIQGNYKLREDAAWAYLDMVAAARVDGVSWSVSSAYRSAKYQAKLFADAVKKYGSQDAARTWVAPPGKSNHGLGITVDIGDLYGKRSIKAARGHPVYEWLRVNAVKYGFMQRMEWEAWHWEYHGDNVKNVKMKYK